MKSPAQLASLIYLTTRLFSSPLEAMFTLLIFIISKEAGSTLLQITILAAAKPCVSLLAFYLSSSIINKNHRIKLYLTLANVIGCLPCLLFPFVQNPWYSVMAFSLYTTASRASFPLWVEILKSHLGLDNMKHPILKGTAINYTIILAFPIVMSFWMDKSKEAWRMIFFLLALLQMSSVILLQFLTIQIKKISTDHLPSALNGIIAPWQKACYVLKNNLPFFKYLIMFFLGGGGIVAMQSVLPIYFKDILHLSYKELTLSFSFCKGIFFITTSFVWGYYANRISLYRINFFMNLFTVLFIFCVVGSQKYREWLFLGYAMYGTMQAGSELSWNMSGPIFAQQQDSTFNSSLNLALVGIRGCLCPLIGQLIFLHFGVNCVFIFGIFITLTSLVYALQLDYRYRNHFIIRNA